MTVRDVTDRLQEINREISEMVWCPEVDDYPESLDTLQLPVALTDIEEGQFNGGRVADGSTNQSEDVYVIRVLFEALGQSDLGEKKGRGLDIYDAYRTKYLDQDTWGDMQDFVLQESPYRAQIRPPFRTSGLTVIEYPPGTEQWWHGFEIRFTVVEDWEWDCD